MGGDSLNISVDGSPVDTGGVCLEHGETACVITAYSERTVEPSQAILEDLGRRLRDAQALRHTAAES